MYKEVVSSIDSIEIFPIISFVIFFVFFTFLLFQVWRSDKSLMEKMSAVPIDALEQNNDEVAIINEQEKRIRP